MFPVPTQNGYADRSASNPEDARKYSFRQWCSLATFHNCCTELHELSQSLIGERIFPNEEHDMFATIYFILPCLERSGGAIQFFALNQLTGTTAFDLLHMLSHLQHHAFDKIINRQRLGINPRILDLLPPDAGSTPYSLKCNALCFYDVPGLSALVGSSRRIKFGEMQILHPYGIPYAIDETLALVLFAGNVCKKMSFVVGKSTMGAIVEVGSNLSRSDNISTFCNLNSFRPSNATTGQEMW